MSETHANYETARAAEAVRFEKRMVDESVRVMLEAARKWQTVANLDGNAWRCVIQGLYERIGEVEDGRA